MTTPAFDPARYPRTYTASAGWLTVWWVIGGGMGVGGVAMAVDEFLHPHPEFGKTLAAAAPWLAMALLGLAALASLLRARVVVGRDFIEAGSFRTWRLERADIVDYHVHVHDGMREFRLRSRARRRPFKFTQVFKADADFAAWFEGLVDSDRLQHDAALARIAGDDTLGAMPATRLERAGQARRIARWLTLASFVVTLWSVVRPQPHGLVMSLLALLPLLALALAWRAGNVFSLVHSRTSPRADLSALVIAPSVLLALRGLYAIDLVDPWAPLLPALAIGALLAALAISACSELRAAPVSATAMAFLCVLYAAGLLTLVNTGIDPRAPGRSTAVITAMRHTSGKGGSPKLTLAGLPGQDKPVERRVSEALYRRAAVGGSVCVADHAGLLGWRWTEVDGPSACAAG